MKKTFCDNCSEETSQLHTFTYPQGKDIKSTNFKTLELCISCLLKASAAAIKELQKIKKEKSERY